MRMVESGKGITFIPELAVSQLNEEQKQMVRPFAIPRPTRQIVLATSRDFIRHSLLNVLKEEILAAVPKDMPVSYTHRDVYKRQVLQIPVADNLSAT